MNEERAETRSPSRRPSQTSESYTEPRTASDVWIPNHPLHPAEADLRLVVNRIPRERPDWWLFTSAGRRKREVLERLGWWAA